MYIMMTLHSLRLNLSQTIFQGDCPNLDTMLITFKNELNSLVWAANMPSRLKKFRKLWGHVSRGHSHIGKHWKHPGCRGHAGGMHHHRINFDKYHSGYFGRTAMRHYHFKRNQSFCQTLNLDKRGPWSVSRHR